MRFSCDTCDVGLTSICQWVAHLVGEVHQNKSLDIEDTVITVTDSEGRNLQFVLQTPKVLKWNDNDRKRSILVTGFAEKNISIGMMSTHFSGYGFITDVVADAAKGYAVIQFDSKESVNKVLQFSGNCVIQGKSCTIQALEEVKELEWLLLLELDSVCTKEEMPNLIQHVMTMAAVRGYALYDQFVFWFYRTSVIGQDLTVRRGLIKDLETILRLKFPSVYTYNMTLLHPGAMDFDEAVEIYVDPFSHCGAAYSTPLQPDYVCFKYQQAIQHMLYILQNQTVGNLKKMYHEISTFPGGFVAGGSPVVTGINFCQNGIPCRLRFDSAMNANVSSLISFYVDLDPRVLPFLRFIHYWARLHGLTKKYPEFKFVLTMMGIIHLQRKYILPSVSMLQQLAYSTGSNSSVTGHSWVEGCNVSFSRDVSAINAYLKSKGKDLNFLSNGTGDGVTAAGNVGLDTFIPHAVSQKTISAVLENLMEFFAAFGTNDLGAYVASPVIGNLFSRSMFLQQNLNEGDLAVKKIQDICAGLDLASPLVVQHPFDMKRNIAEDIDHQFVLYTQGLFREMAGRLRNAVQGSNRSLMCVFSDVLPHLHRIHESKHRGRDSGCSSLLISDLTQNDSAATLATASKTSKNKSPPSRPRGMSYSHVARKAAGNSAPAVGIPTLTSSTLGNPTDSFLSPSFKCFKFELSKQFRISFLETCQGLGGTTKLKEKMVILAVIFMRDFSWSTWGRCYYLTNDTFKVAESDPTFQQISRMFKEYSLKSSSKNSSADSDSQSMSDLVDGNDLRFNSTGNSDDSGELPSEGDDKDRSSGESGGENSPPKSNAAADKNGWSFVQRKGGDASDKLNVTCTSKYKELSEKEKKEDLRVKFGKIPKCACKNYCVTMKLKGFHRVWVSRRAKRLSVMSRDSTSKFCGNLLLQKETELLINPMDKEEAVTAAVVESVQGHGGKFPAARALWSLEATVKIDITGEYPVLYMALKEGRSPKVCQNMFNYFGNIFPEMYADYMMYRLKKWVVTAGGGGGSPHSSVSH